MQYIVLTGINNGIPELEDKVTNHLNQGWKPIGGIAFNQGYPYQAMAIAKKPAEKPQTKEPPQHQPIKNIASDDYY
jgi:hypothetical protein